MLFSMASKNKNLGRKTHCGVLEFVAEEGVIHMPHWVSALAAEALFRCRRSFLAAVI